jgi:cyclin-dependent kinase 7
MQALSHRFFTSYPLPTAPRQLPKPLAELRPRTLAPDETQGKAGTALKRKAESPNSALPGKRVARKLFA